MDGKVFLVGMWFIYILEKKPKIVLSTFNQNTT